MSEHSPEPWVLKLADRRREYGQEVEEIFSPSVRERGAEQATDRDPIVETDSGYYGPTEADARRIVACVNACAGIPTEALERGALRAFLSLAKHHGRLPAVTDAVLQQLHLPEDYGKPK